VAKNKTTKTAKKPSTKPEKAENPLKVGQKAPAFSALADSGEKVSSKDLKGKSYVLYFYPKNMTPGCTIEAQDFQKALPNFKKKNVEVIGVSKDSVDRHLKFKDKYDLKFTLISDEDGKVCEKFGVWRMKSFMGRKFLGIVRTTFVVDKTGTIVALFDEVKVKDHVKEVLALL